MYRRASRPDGGQTRSVAITGRFLPEQSSGLIPLTRGSVSCIQHRMKFWDVFELFIGGGHFVRHRIQGCE